MKRVLKSIIAVSLCALLLLGTMAIGGDGLADVLESFVIKASAVSSGTCGNNVTYTLDEDTGLLTICGLGDMQNYDWNSSPFYNNSSIKSIVVESGVTSIGFGAFSRCTGLKSITIGNSVSSICDGAFFECTSLESITIPNSVKNIGELAFYRCSGIKNIAIGNSVTSIGVDSFHECTSLESITIPNSVTSIGTGAFYECSNLKNITLPDHVISIGSYAFFDTEYFDNESNWENGVLYIGNHLIAADNKIIPGVYSIKNGTITISNYAFFDCDKLTNISIPNSVTSIGKGAFNDCTSLKSITVPENVENVGVMAFCGCTDLTQINWNAKKCIDVTDENDGFPIFGMPESVVNVTFGNSVETIPAYLFSNLNVEAITIPDSVKHIGECAFYCCTSLKSLTIGNSVTSIGNEAFFGCTKLTTAVIGSSVTKIGDLAFAECENLRYVYMPDHYVKIYDETFKNCLNLTICCKEGSYWNSYCIENGMKYCLLDEEDNNSFVIKNQSLVEYCGSDTNVVIPSVVSLVGHSSFKDNAKVETVEIPYCVSQIADEAFENCNKLKSVIVPFTVTSIGKNVFKNTNTKLICYNNSYAHNYAKQNNISYELITVSFESDNVKMLQGDTKNINATPSVNLQCGVPMVMKSSNPEVATVDAYGNVTAVKNGTTDIQVYAPNNTLLGECTVSVNSATPAPEYSIKNMSTYNGKTIEYKSTITISYDVKNCTDVKWHVTGAKYTNNADGSITINQATSDFSVYFTAKDLDGKEVKSETETVKVNAGFFAKLIAFFKGLFNTLPNIKQ